MDPPSVSFTAFTAKVEAQKNKFQVEGSFTLAPSSHGLDVLKEEVALGLTGGTAAFCTTISGGSFHAGPKGQFTFEGTMNGVALEVRIAPVSSTQFTFQVEGTGANLAGIANPVTVALTIGDDSGSTTVTAELKGDSQ
jgi:hypothetical protein